jgi:hypothetical protein
VRKEIALDILAGSALYFAVVTDITGERNASNDGDESGQGRDEGEDPHSLWKECVSLRECGVAENEW